MNAIPMALAALIVLSSSVDAQAQASNPPTAASAAMSEGEVRKVDKDAGKLTLRHGPIDNLGMPGMTMVFKVADPKVLENLKEGDKVRFKADRVNGAITITNLEQAR